MAAGHLKLVSEPRPFDVERALLEPDLVDRTDRGCARGVWFWDWLRGYAALAHIEDRRAHLYQVVEKWPIETRRRARRILLLEGGEDTPPPPPEEPELPPLEAVEAEHINRVIVRVRGSIAEAAAMLGLSRSTVYRKLEAMPPEWRSAAVKVALDRRRKGVDDAEE